MLYGFVPFMVDDRERAVAAGQKLAPLIFALAEVVRARATPDGTRLREL